MSLVRGRGCAKTWEIGSYRPKYYPLGADCYRVCCLASWTGCFRTLGQFHFYTWFAHCPLVFALSLHLAQNGFSAISGPCWVALCYLTGVGLSHLTQIKMFTLAVACKLRSPGTSTLWGSFLHPVLPALSRLLRREQWDVEQTLGRWAQTCWILAISTSSPQDQVIPSLARWQLHVLKKLAPLTSPVLPLNFLSSCFSPEFTTASGILDLFLYQ